MLPIWHRSRALKIRLCAERAELMGALPALSAKQPLILWHTLSAWQGSCRALLSHQLSGGLSVVFTLMGEVLPFPLGCLSVCEFGAGMMSSDNAAGQAEPRGKGDGCAGAAWCVFLVPPSCILLSKAGGCVRHRGRAQADTAAQTSPAWHSRCSNPRYPRTVELD